jgi:methanogenic corrinoid protein MtbC1
VALRAEAIGVVTERFYAKHGSVYAQYGPRGREACREDLAFHLDFLRPVLEFGLLRPMVDYLVWLSSVLGSRAIPVDHLGLSLDWLGEYYAMHLDAADGGVVSAALQAVHVQFEDAKKHPMKTENPEPWPEAGEFEAALLAGRQHDATSVVNRCLDGGRSLVDIELHVIVPSLYEIGHKWQRNQVNVAQEHLATAIAQLVMTLGLSRSSPPPTVGRRVLLACVEGNYHAVGLQMVSDAFQLAGWGVDYLGANVPTSALVAYAKERKPDLIGLSVSFAQQLRVAKDAIARLITSFDGTPPAVFLGGLAINRFHELASIAGADAHCGDPAAALAFANQHVTSRG